MRILEALSLGDVFDEPDEVLWRLGGSFGLFVQAWMLRDGGTVGADSRVLLVRLGRWDPRQDQWLEVREVGVTSRSALRDFCAEHRLGWKFGFLPCGPIEATNGRVL